MSFTITGTMILFLLNYTEQNLSNNIQYLSAIFMIISLTTAVTNYALRIINLFVALITPTFLSRLNNGINPVLDVQV